MARSGQLVLAVACAALGGLAGYALRGGGGARVETREVARVVPVTVAGRAVGPSVEEMRALIREELAHTPAAAAPRVEPAPSVDLAAAAKVDEAEEQLDAAAARGTWGTDDATALRGLLADVPDSERAGLMARLARSLNDGTLRLDPGAVPL